MTREEHLVQAKADKERAKRYGDFIAQIDAEYLISDLERMTDGEYEAYIKLRKMYSHLSVTPTTKGK